MCVQERNKISMVDERQLLSMRRLGIKARDASKCCICELRTTYLL